ncbi:Asp-domain-containing protein [Polychaeton citri CBS 116435]|uniref:Asp-domain-containing protein n=1 Tax=Polychaeton citri CBS 116435 TaxID=1314669 RepID=A0A9P4PXS2_9PEZI|nr:Asp-domain-containing protein [Polychaeton citri CBS 116435]
MHKIFAKYGWLEQGITPLGLELHSGISEPVESLLSNVFGPTSTAAAVQTSVAPHFAASNATTTSAGSSGTGSPTSGGDGTAEVTSTPEDNNSEYLTPVTVGGQKLTLDFDTGSADLWVFSSQMSSSEQGQHGIYDPSKSSNYQNLTGGTWKIQYGDQSGASGTVGYDVVAVGEATATKQAVELATQVSQQFEQDTNSDGLLGLAFGSINTVKVNGRATPQKTFFENVMDSLEKPLFSVDLNEQDGTYEFGAIDDSKYSGELHYVDIDNSGGFWQFDSTEYSVGGKTSQNSGASPAIADTGTSLLLTDDAVVKAYYAQVNGAKLDSTQGGYVYPCSADLPDFGVQVGDYMVNLKGSGLTYAQIDQTGKQCFGGIQSNAGAGVQIFGDVLLRQTYAVFDGGNLQFGIAPKN